MLEAGPYVKRSIYDPYAAEAAKVARAAGESDPPQVPAKPAEPEVVVVEAAAPNKSRQCDIWKHYKKKHFVNGRPKAECLICGKLVSAANTTNLRSGAAT